MSWAPYVHPSGEYIIFASNKLGFENFELFMVDAQGTKEPVRVTYSDGFDGLPVPSPDGKTLAWTSSRSGGVRRPAVPRAVEPREGARGAQERAAEKADQEIMRHQHHATNAEHAEHAELALLCGLGDLCVRSSSQRPRDAQASKTRAHVEALASPRLEGRLAGSNGERLASDYLVAELQKIGAKPLPGQQRLPAAVRVHGRHADGGSTVGVTDTRPASSREPFDARTDVQALSFSDNGDVDRRRSSSPATASSCPRARTSATTATRRST